MAIATPPPDAMRQLRAQVLAQHALLLAMFEQHPDKSGVIAAFDSHVEALVVTCLGGTVDDILREEIEGTCAGIRGSLSAAPGAAGCELGT